VGQSANFDTTRQIWGRFRGQMISKAYMKLVRQARNISIWLCRREWLPQELTRPIQLRNALPELGGMRV
jgi:hypothetical protein